MKLTVEQIPPAEQEEILVRCHDTEQPWVKAVQGAAAGQITVNGVANGKFYRLKLGDIYYFEVVEGSSFLYGKKEVFSCKLKLYEFEALCSGTMLFRCSKSNVGLLLLCIGSAMLCFGGAWANREQQDEENKK